jgi:hypothetical protein
VVPCCAIVRLLEPWLLRPHRGAFPGLKSAALSALVLVSLAVGHRIYVHQLEKVIAMAAAHDHHMDLVVLRRTDWAYSGQSSARFVQSNFPETPELVHLITPVEGTFEKVRYAASTERTTRTLYFECRQAKRRFSYAPRGRMKARVRPRLFTT